ncbi:hypothetical protein LOZ53_000708 [Ophidiomyces ophidiicola]|nr:hypothetical protein LOZ55_001985 [Ophidiomyces ophidiicola]KAI1997348.1 hypothetical protein LOZ53_000708 [Ophidiomyces ophidiicola]
MHTALQHSIWRRALSLSLSRAQRPPPRLFRHAPTTHCLAGRSLPTRALSTDTHTNNEEAAGVIVPLRKELKEKARAKKRRAAVEELHEADDDGEWELTVGIEVHAQLDTDAKLFSGASSAQDDEPNSNVALFDLAFPGSQPIFQAETLIPALRAAIALEADVQRVSRFDRKHYFYHDQPAGYQITQYYEPYAKNGVLRLYARDGLAAADGACVEVGIQQLQLEQDTAKSQELPGRTYALDFNRVSRPLIEIITRPQLHSAAAAAACVRKLAAVLAACGAATTGMEHGGLRADVNVSVRRRGDGALGQRTEIKNLSSFKAVEDAVAAERRRQIAVLAAGGAVAGETRAWTLGGAATRRLRGKEGAVDYRYMPDADLAPVVVGADLLAVLHATQPPLPDALVAQLTHDARYGLSTADAQALVALDGGARLEYYQAAVAALAALQAAAAEPAATAPGVAGGRALANWTLHELGGLFGAREQAWDSGRVPAAALAEIVHRVARRALTGGAAKAVLARVFDGDRRPVARIVADDGLAFAALADAEYDALARRVVDEAAVGGGQAKPAWLLGCMMRAGGRGRMEPGRARAALERELARRAEQCTIE